MKETLKAWVLLERNGLLVNVEKAARILGVYNLVCNNSNQALWDLAHAPEEPTGQESTVVGSAPIVEIRTETPPQGAAPGRRPTIKKIVTR